MVVGTNKDVRPFETIGVVIMDSVLLAIVSILETFIVEKRDATVELDELNSTLVVMESVVLAASIVFLGVSPVFASNVGIVESTFEESVLVVVKLMVLMSAVEVLLALVLMPTVMVLDPPVLRSVVAVIESLMLMSGVIAVESSVKKSFVAVVKFMLLKKLVVLS